MWSGASRPSHVCGTDVTVAGCGVNTEFLLIPLCCSDSRTCSQKKLCRGCSTNIGRKEKWDVVEFELSMASRWLDRLNVAHQKSHVSHLFRNQYQSTNVFSCLMCHCRVLCTNCLRFSMPLCNLVNANWPQPRLTTCRDCVRSFEIHTNSELNYVRFD